MVKKLNTSSQFNVVEENLAELENAIRVIEEGNVDGIVSIDVKKGHKPKGLPKIEIDKVEADTYFKISDGVIHLNEVKNTPNAFVSKLQEGLKKDDGGQFGRYARWMEKGVEQNQVRETMVFIRNSEPKFHKIIDNKILSELKKIVPENKDIPIIQIKNRNFTYEELEQFTSDAYAKLRELKKKNKKLKFSEIADKYFNSMEDSFEILGKNYGH